MPHLVLLGDSILDNGAYTEGGPAVVAQTQDLLPSGWQCTLCAVDGSIAEDVPAQVAALPLGATSLVLSVGGNNAILRAEVLETPVASSGEALLLLYEATREFERAYRAAVEACLAPALPLVLCTIYNGNFLEPSYQKRATTALAVFNDVVFRVATEKGLRVIDLRLVCSEGVDYANPIEPSSVGGKKIARAIVHAVTEPYHASGGAHVVAT